MTSNDIYRNEMIDDRQRKYCKTFSSIRPEWYEQTVTSTTTTTINKETNSTTDEMTRTHLEKSPLRRLNIVTGPQSAFARLFPERYRQEQEEMSRKQRSKSSCDQDRYNFDRQTTANERKSRHVSFYKQYPSDYDISSDIPLNYDPNPEIIHRENPNNVVYIQKVGVRYLEPPTPPPLEPLIIRERHATPPPEPPPMVIDASPPVPPRTPSPIIVREQPPTPPIHQPTKIITKTLPTPPARPRRVIIKRIPPLPVKPRPVIIEKWLPYKTPTERPILYERAEQIDRNQSPQRNVILQYEPARVRIEQEIQNAGYFRVDPELYRAQFGSELRRTDSIRRLLQNIGCNPNILTTPGYNTSSISSQHDSSEQRTTCFTDEQLSHLIATSKEPQTYYTTVLSNN